MALLGRILHVGRLLILFALFAKAVDHGSSSDTPHRDGARGNLNGVGVDAGEEEVVGNSRMPHSFAIFAKA